jgi:glutathione synthase/RimK-type ligase-like ATP-grasp enzyme
MIYLIGLDSDRTFCHFTQVATELGVDLQIINLRAIVQEGDWSFQVPVAPQNPYSAWVNDGQHQIFLDPKAAYYCRIIDLSSVQIEAALANRWRAFVTAISVWLEQIPGKVVNRPGFRSDNNSKPLHELCLQYYGFQVAASLTSSDGARLYDFAKAQPTIVKAISGIRADSRLVEAEEFVTFIAEQGPVHLQEYIAGDDVRVHVIGDQYIAERVHCPTVDYRRDHELSEYFPLHRLPEPLAAQIIQATKAFGLTFAGWDFKLTPEGEYYCLEANPMPGYDGYDRRCDHKVTQVLIDYLSAGEAFSSSSKAEPLPYPEAFLSPTECERVKEAIAQLEKRWLPRGRNDRLFCTLGAASYLDCGDYQEPEDTYWQKAARYNPVLWEHFGWLYDKLQNHLEALLQAPVAYREDAALPGFHLWLAEAIPTRSLVSMHCDLQYQHLPWPAQSPIDFSQTLSFTLPIALPASGGGLDLCDLSHLDYLDMRPNNAIDWQLIPRFRNRQYHPYHIGHLVLHSGYTLHRVAPTSAATPTDQRITLQGHAVQVDGVWQLYW